jgi:sugar (pentulose or hexulose) kinase
MTDLMLTRLGAEVGDLIVEGSFAENLAYCGLLAALRPHQKVLVRGDSAGTARGAALLARWPEPFPEIELGGPIEPLSIEGLTAYRAAWNDAVQ